ncbi:hypothetical protein TWF173_000253 [Orbilia oligospora]|uniref:Extracellular membrane protein CFEM domain-containing protein n=2 Tax=Orbilia oligospora TaxID=2813651 RepID=G1XQF8_ARTOA|nr:hypothetical protein AOL_s00188g170 [Orbilia oligospora ATCC 24927]EGX44502.1 hypothetical protein AOL_s00188g170 [Orbilia oligospora ATCC 24927]KAF3280590.1 hypothetical protein TWF970_002803 [Orbilia oligospora]KAF3319640.1 hypothetical protein TWF173_000253 [Orbilia oligospora]
MKTFFTAIILGIFAITTCAREVDVETTTSAITSTHTSHKPIKTHPPTTLVAKKTTSTTSTFTPRPTCDVVMFRIDCPETPDPCCSRIIPTDSGSGFICASEWDAIDEGVEWESCVETTTTSSSEITVPTGYAAFAAADGKGGNVTTITTTVVSFPEPTYSSGASGAKGLRMGGPAAFGLLGLVFAIHY